MSTVFPPGVRCGFLDFITDGVTRPDSTATKPTKKPVPGPKGVTKKRGSSKKQLIELTEPQLRLVQRAVRFALWSRGFVKSQDDTRVLKRLMRLLKVDELEVLTRQV